MSIPTTPETIPTDPETYSGPILHGKSRSDNPSEGQLFGKNMRCLVKVVHQAILNPCELREHCRFLYVYIDISHSVYVPWDVEQYYLECVKCGQEEREKNLHKFPCPSFGSHTEPLTIVDSRGRIVLWYLPGLLSIKQQVSEPARFQ